MSSVTYPIFFSSTTIAERKSLKRKEKISKRETYTPNTHTAEDAHKKLHLYNYSSLPHTRAFHPYKHNVLKWANEQNESQRYMPNLLHRAAPRDNTSRWYLAGNKPPHKKGGKVGSNFDTKCVFYCFCTPIKWCFALGNPAVTWICLQKISNLITDRHQPHTSQPH